MKVVFDSSVKEDLLDIFDKAVDEDGYIVEKSDFTQKVETPHGQEIKIDKFGGIQKGSEIFLRSDIATIIELSDQMK